MDNPFRKVEVSSVEVALKVRRARDVAFIRSVRLKEKEVIAGKKATLVVTLKPYQGEPLQEEFTFEMPRGLSEGQQVTFIAADALSAERMNRAIYPGKYTPTSLKQLINLIETRRRNTYLSVFAMVPTSAISMKGYAMPSLPSSIFSVISSSRRSGARMSSGCLRLTRELPFVVQGTESITIRVGEEK